MPRTPAKKPPLEALAREIERIELKFRESAEELRSIHRKFRLAARAEAEIRSEIAEIREEWDDLNHKWWAIVLVGALIFAALSYFFYTNLGWHADQRALPPSSDWLLDRLPTVNLLPVLSWGWLALHLYAAAVAVLYYPRQLTFLLFLLGNLIFVRSIYVFLSPIGAPADMLDMSRLDYLFSRIMGTFTFTNEFVFSGHTGIPFVFFLFFETRLQKTIFLTGSIIMGASVLLTKNHYTVDVISAYFICYAIYGLSRRAYFHYLHPLFLNQPYFRELVEKSLP